MKWKLTAAAIGSLVVVALSSVAVWMSQAECAETYIALRELPGITQEVLTAQDKLFHVEEPVLYNRDTGIAFFVVEIISQQNFENERYLTFGGDATSLQNFVGEINLVNNGPSRMGSTADGMVQGVEGLVSGVLNILRHPIATLEGLGNAVSGLAKYVWDTTLSQIQDDVSNLVKAYYINRACEIAEAHGVDYFELKTESGRATIHSETNWKIGGQAAIEIAVLLVPFSKAKDAAKAADISVPAAQVASDAAEVANVVRRIDKAAEIAVTAKRFEEAGAISKGAANFSRVGSFFPRMVTKMTETLTRLKHAVAPSRFVPPVARFGKATTANYKATFFEFHPELAGKVEVHHAVEQQALTRYPGLLSEEEIHSLENLRGIPLDRSADLHKSQIRKEWNEFYRNNPATGMTKQKLLDKASEIDRHYGKSFSPAAI